MSNIASSPLARQLRTGMGWFSGALGAPQVLGPDAVNTLCGLPTGGVRRTTQRLIGVRELAAAAGLLTRSNRRAWMKARVVGDLMDIALLTRSLGSSTRRSRTTLAIVGVLGVTVIDLVGA